MLKKSLLPGLFLFASIIAASLAYPWLLKRVPVSQSQWARAQTGVQHNVDWKPVIRQHNHMDWSLVPAGCFQLGSTESQKAEAVRACQPYGGDNCPYVYDLPAQPVCFDAPYWITTTEITNSQYGVGYESNADLPYPMPRIANWPRESINWQEAVTACKNLSARLPSEAEWEYAARGPDGLIYPWGNAMSPEYLQQAWRLSPQRVGEVQADTSWVGAVDMAGNIAEWVTSLSDTEPQMARGGSWASYADFLLRTTQRMPYESEYRSSTVGFRCVRNAQP